MFSAAAQAAAAGTRYRFRLGDGKTKSGAARVLVPDPASRFQPEGPHGPSQVVDPGGYRWTDGDWRGPASVDGQVIYVLHLGTFTPEGTWAAAVEQLAFLADLGITAVEVMPVAQFPGTFGWRLRWRRPFRPFHGLRQSRPPRSSTAPTAWSLAALLDVVCNHLGPDGNYLPSWSRTTISRSGTRRSGARRFEFRR